MTSECPEVVETWMLERLEICDPCKWRMQDEVKHEMATGKKMRKEKLRQERKEKWGVGCVIC